MKEETWLIDFSCFLTSLILGNLCLIFTQARWKNLQQLD